MITSRTAAKLIEWMTPTAVKLAAQCSRLEATEPDDLIQTALLNLMKSDSRYQHLPSDAERRSYATTAVHNASIDVIRRARARKAHNARYAETISGRADPGHAGEIELADLLRKSLTAAETELAALLAGGVKAKDLGDHGWDRKDRSRFRSRLDLLLA